MRVAHIICWISVTNHRRGVGRVAESAAADDKSQLGWVKDIFSPFTLPSMLSFLLISQAWGLKSLCLSYTINRKHNKRPVAIKDQLWLETRCKYARQSACRRQPWNCMLNFDRYITVTIVWSIRLMMPTNVSGVAHFKVQNEAVKNGVHVSDVKTCCLQSPRLWRTEIPLRSSNVTWFQLNLGRFILAASDLYLFLRRIVICWLLTLENIYQNIGFSKVE